MTKRILVAGGYGTVGSHICKHLRALESPCEIVIAGRRPSSGAALAREVGASVCELDVTNAESVRAAVSGCDIVLAAVKDPQDRLLGAACVAGAAMVAITHSADTVAGPLFLHRHAPTSIDYVTAGHWQAGMAVHAARQLVLEFSKVQSMVVTALFDPADAAGPMAREDSGEYMSRAVVRQNGRVQWVSAQDSARTMTSESGDEFRAMPMGVLDTLSLAALTDAADIRFEIGIAPSVGTRAGRGPSHDIYFEISGLDQHGSARTTRSMLSARAGQAHFTAIGVAAIADVLIKRPAGARGEWFLPESLVDPKRALSMAESLAGAKLRACIERTAEAA